jgi:hypothetical protein
MPCHHQQYLILENKIKGGRPLKDQFKFKKINPCGICGGQTGTETDTPLSQLVSPVALIPLIMSTNLFV